MNHGICTASMRRSPLAASAVAFLIAGFAHGPAVAASDPPSKTIDIRAWKADPTGWSVKTLVGKKVKGPKGEDVGEVENVVFGPDGTVHKLIVSTGGILDIGDKNLAVKWSDVKIGPNYEYVTTPITAESVEKYGLFDGVPEKTGTKAPREWRSSELIGDYVNLKGGARYAYVRDLIVSQQGQLEAVIVTPDVGYGRGLRGYYAYPFYGYRYGWNPGVAHYDLPYGKTDIADLVPYAYHNNK